jgi:hypothetical protein
MSVQPVSSAISPVQSFNVDSADAQIPQGNETPVPQTLATGSSGSLSGLNLPPISYANQGQIDNLQKTSSGGDVQIVADNRDRIRNGGRPIFASPVDPNALVNVRPGVFVGGGENNQGLVKVDSNRLSTSEQAQLNRELQKAYERSLINPLTDSAYKNGLVGIGAGAVTGGIRSPTPAGVLLGGLTGAAAGAVNYANDRRIIERDYTIKVNDLLEKAGLDTLTADQLLRTTGPNRFEQDY